MTVRRFVFPPNREEVFKVVTDCGITGYISASIPVEAIEKWIRRLGPERKRGIGRLRYIERQGRRRRFEPIRVRVRRRARKKIYRGPWRFRSRAPRG